MATLANAATREEAFWQKIALGMAIFIVLGFMQFAARGFVDVGRVPLHVHLHGAIMLGWLALAVAQPWLVHRDNLAAHRRLGRLGVALAALVVAIGSYTGISAAATGRQPPFFTPPYFLALTQVSVAIFGGLVIAAVVNRRRTQWHRRLMLGAMILILEPALGRVLPMPLMMPWGEWAVLAIQLAVLGIVARHDLRAAGRVHPATVTVAAVLIIAHGLVETLAVTPAWAALAARLG